MMKEIILKKRERNSHKGTYGKTLIVAGSYGMAGAALMCGKAAVKSGVGLVRFLVDVELFDVLQSQVPEATCMDKKLHYDIDLNEYKSIAIGPGIGKGKSNIGIIKRVLNEYTGTLIVDADALNCIMKYALYGNVTQSKANVILTPHMAEAARLLEVDRVLDDERKEKALELSQSFNSTVVMKGNNTIVVSNEEIYFNETGNPGMATGGAGDVLTGVIAALAAQGYEPFEASKIGVYVHGLAGDICEAEIGQIGMTAIDILDKVPKAFKTIQEKNG